MAKRKKLNRRVVIFLSVLGGIFVIGIVAVIIARLPKDPTVLAAKAEEALKNEDWREAVRNYGMAGKSAEELGDPRAAEYYFEAAKTYLDWAANDPHLTQAGRSDRAGRGYAALQTALRVDPDYVEAQEYLCDLLWPRAVRFGDWRRYADAADKLLELKPDDHQTYFRRARARAELAGTIGGEWVGKALADYRKAIELKPDETDYWRTMIGFVVENKRRTDAEEVFEEALAANPDSAEIRVLHAAYLRTINEDEAAREEIEKAIEVEPDNATGYLQLCQMRFAEDDREGAFQAVRQAREVDPTNPQVYTVWARLHAAQREPEKATAILQEGLEALTERVTQLTGSEKEEDQLELARLRTARVDLDYLLADMLLDQARPGEEGSDELVAEAKSCLEQLERRAPESAHQKKIAGRIALYEGRAAEAVELLQQAHDAFVRRGQIDATTASTLIGLYDRQGNPGQGDQVLDEVLTNARQRRHPPTLLLKARREIRYRRYDQALEWVNRVLRIDPDNAEARELQWVLEAARGDSEVVEVPAEGEISDQSIGILMDRAQSLWVEQRQSEAVALLEQLHERAPEGVGVVVQLARMYVAQDQTQKAEALLTDAQQRLGDSEAIAFELERLRQPDPERRFEMLLERVDGTVADDPVSAALAKASICAMYGRDQQERQFLEEARRIDPNLPSVVSRWFSYAIRQENWDLAQQYAEKGAELDLDGLQGAGMQIRLAEARGQYEDAIASLKELLRQRPDIKRAWNSLGDCYLQTEQYEQAEEAYNEALKRDPADASAVIGLARATHAQGKRQEHEKWVRRAYQLPGGRRSLYIKKEYLRYEEQGADDQDIAERLIPAREELRRQRPADVDNLVQLARLYERLERYDDAEKIYRFIFENADHPRQAAIPLAGYYVRTEQTSEIDKLFSHLLSEAESPQEKAQIYVTWSGFLQYYSLDQALAAVDKAIEIAPEYPEGYRAKARYLARQERWGEVIELMQSYLDFDPEDAASAEKDLILYMIRDGRTDEAQRRIDRILTEDPTDPKALTLKGILARRQGELDRAEALFNRAIELNPDSPLPLRYRTRLYLARGQLSEARDDLQKAWQLEGDATLGVQLAQVYERLDQLQAAENVYKDILAEYPRQQEATRGLLGLYLRQSDWDQLSEGLGQAKKTFPDDPTWWVYEGSMWRRRERPGRQLEAYRQAMQRAGKAPSVVRGYLGALLQNRAYEELQQTAASYVDDPDLGAVVRAYQGAALVGSGQVQEGENLLAEAVREVDEEQLSSVVAVIGTTYDPVQAAQKFDQWADARNNDWLAYYHLADMYKKSQARTGRNFFSEVVAAYEKALELAPDAASKVSVQMQLALAHVARGQWTEAENCYLAILEADPRNMDALNNLAYIYVDQLERPEQAREYAQRAFEIQPGNHNVVDTYGWTLAKLGEYDEARRQLLHSLRLREMPESRYHLGWVYEKLGQLGQAEYQYERAAEMLRQRPSQDPVRQAVEQALARVRRKVTAE